MGIAMQVMKRPINSLTSGPIQPSLPISTPVPVSSITTSTADTESIKPPIISPLENKKSGSGVSSAPTYTLN